MVGCTISLPGNTPHVTALGSSSTVFVFKSPYKIIVSLKKKTYDDDYFSSYIFVNSKICHFRVITNLCY